MEFGFTREQEILRQEFCDFCKNEPFGEIDTRVIADFSPEYYRKVADKGWLGLSIPREYGGMGYGMIEQVIFYEEMAFHKVPVATVLNGNTVILGGAFILKYGSEEQKRGLLPRMVKGDVLFGQGFTESNAGSDLLALSTYAVREGDYYIINGEKTFQSWVTRVPYLREYKISTYVLVLARTDRNAPPDKSLSLFVIDVTEPLDGMSIHPMMCLDDRVTCGVFFDNVKVEAKNLIGRENKAWDYVIETGAFYWDRRPGYFIGYMKGIINSLVKYVKETKVDGNPLSENVLVRHKLAELAIRSEAVRLDVYRYAWALDRGHDVNGLAAQMKFRTDRLLNYFSSTVMQILGPYGQLKKGAKYVPFGGSMESTYRALLMRSFVSTGPSAMTNVIAGEVLGLPNEFGLIY